MTDATLTSTTSRAAPRRRRSPFRRKAFPYLLVAPAVVYLLAITLYPGIFALWRSFFAGRFQLNFVGFEQYIDLFQDEAFWHSMSNTLIIGGLTLTIEFVIALGLAALVYRDPFVKGWRIIFLLPMLFMPSAVAFLWKLLFNDGRVISDLFMRIGLVDSNIDFMGSTWAARSVLIVTDVWQWVPFLFIIFVAALQGQDKEIEEAARLDGARWRQVFFSISLPMMRPVIAIALVLRGIDILTMFASPHIITQGAPAGDTETVSYFIYRTGFKSFEFGYASAASVIVLILTIIMAQLFVRRFFKSGRD
jgi:multiple sugar transport system permease protein